MDVSEERRGGREGDKIHPRREEESCEDEAKGRDEMNNMEKEREREDWGIW